jgi:hypothetical protein
MVGRIATPFSGAGRHLDPFGPGQRRLAADGLAILGMDPGSAARIVDRAAT